MHIFLSEVKKLELLDKTYTLVLIFLRLATVSINDIKCNYKEFGAEKGITCLYRTDIINEVLIAGYCDT